ncbi:hypothetical protein BBJ29_002651 [Phytophthora kernoviae]|uniref:Temptin Cys/Cys disulfide domain-containing protein n=1 Tax=Phytophthora kernoviae TaxID=325452 RepID=A0A3F2RS22_9STRA|nr:hypothetical protein BBJ29_002651 [Phytophthora kernoviae]RLN63122.1 hypothetical protein BBP00_00004320 [Phytophthora kernoviae]
MRSCWNSVTVACAVYSLCALPDASAYKVFQQKIPNGGNVPGVSAVGHERPNIGGPNNDFGLDFVAAMFQWTKQFCEKDSDGDGQTNGQELGDPCCEFDFRKNKKMRWTEGISHPGDPEFKADPALWEGIVCGGDAEPQEATQEATKAAETAEAAEEQVVEEEEAKNKQEEAAVETEEEVLAAVQGGEAGSVGGGAPALFSSMVLSAGALFVVVMYLVMVSSYSMYAMRVPNGDKVPGVTALGHVDPVLAGPMNEFGMDMIDADFKWTKQLCMKDSDGDGQTNGQELGDPCCEFVFRKNAVVRWSEGVSHPGDAEYTSDPVLWERVVCQEAEGEAAADPLEASSTAVSKVATEGEAKADAVTADSDETKTEAVIETNAETEEDDDTQLEAPILADSGEAGAEGATLKEAAVEGNTVSEKTAIANKTLQRLSSHRSTSTSSLPGTPSSRHSLRWVSIMYDAKSVNGMVPQPPPSKMDFSTFESPLDFDASGASFDDDGGRFVAGEQFYNHEMYGSLRKGGAVDFLSMECLGLAAATFTSMLSYQALLTLVQPMYNTQLGLTATQIVAVGRLVQMPMALSFLVGLLSDCYPIMGLRRKGYMILGCIINGVSVFAIAGVSAALGNNKEASEGMVILALILVALASIGCIITYVCVHTRVIEYSQRESLRDRGAIQASYLIFRRVVSIFTSVLSFLALGTGSEPNMSVSAAMIVLGVISVLPLPLIFRYWNEEVYSLNTSMKIRSQILWKIMQQKAVWRILAFIWFFTLFLGIKFSDSTSVVTKWAGASGDNSLLVKTIQDLVMIGIMLIWRYLFINRLWPIFFALAPAFQILPNLFVSLMVALDIVRNRYFYRVFYSMTYVSDGIGLLNTIVPVTEIVQEGSEGALVGLTLTLQRCVNIFVDTNANGIFQGTNYYNTVEVAKDTPDARWDVLLSLFLNFALNALAWVGLFFLPSQKLDAQQLRMYGGFTKAASAGIIGFCLLLFIYGFVMTLMSLIPSTSCFVLVGGSGC